MPYTFQTAFNILDEYVPFINEEINLDKISEDNFCKEKDLVIADASEDYADIGKSIELINLNNKKVLAGLHTFLARPDQGSLSKGFGGYLMQSWNVRKQIMLIAQGSKVLGISMKRLAKLITIIPEEREQEKIANLLIDIDSKIQQFQQKKGLLESYKKGVMQQIFKQEIRFKKNKGVFPKWKNRRMNELLSTSGVRNAKLRFSKQEVLSVSGEYGIVNQIEHMGRSYAGVSVANYHVVEIGDIVYTKSPLKANPYGIIKLNKGNAGIVSTLYAVYKVKEKEALGLYLDLYFSLDDNLNRYLRPLVRKGAKNDMKINNDYVLNDKISIPSVEEQQKIVDYGLALDERIKNTRELLEEMEFFKKGLLQKLFV